MLTEKTPPSGEGAPACLVCGGTMAPALRYPGLLACGACGFHTADVDLAPEEIHALYGPDYFHGAEYSDYVQEKDALQANFAGRLDEILALPGIGPDSSLYEIGCAYGFFLEMAAARFARVAGIDIADGATAHARDTLKLNAATGDFLDTGSPPFAPDVICMWDVIEHLEHPDRVIEKAARSLAPGGYILVTTGDLQSLVARMRGDKWRMIHPPTHLHYFARSNLCQLLTQHGLEIVGTTYPAVKRTIGAMLYGVFHLRLGMPKTYKALSRLPGQGISIPINFFDIMCIVARKQT